MAIEQPYGPESRPQKRSVEQIKHEKALGGLREDYDPAFHSENLYDQNEGAGGEVLDLRTGLPIDNSTQTDADFAEGHGATFIASEPGEPLLPPLPEEEDKAAEWLAQHENPERADQQEAA